MGLPQRPGPPAQLERLLQASDPGRSGARDALALAPRSVHNNPHLVLVVVAATGQAGAVPVFHGRYRRPPPPTPPPQPSPSQSELAPSRRPSSRCPQASPRRSWCRAKARRRRSLAAAQPGGTLGGVTLGKSPGFGVI
ncbi:unnamed protein product [Rangifer tarandus platyrhynchus]|uniref:Uncharacterized protein n=1 Tax=Rangifer tarandus platyrhynchus TaxID=3082113 RepID=A0ABN8YCH4_RANTA|nr:unnamed protein product [Rangifer tarandus platyrhynchus]